MSPGRPADEPEMEDPLHGRRFDDPYVWLERLDATDTREWIAAQEAVTHAVLRAVPGRDALRAAVACSARHARLSPPIPAGPHGREFLWRADADDASPTQTTRERRWSTTRLTYLFRLQKIQKNG
jgi:prolyl oligopeptidase PreP (S9A serine peptidase family)